jgi:hypothetical protein
MDYNEKTKLDTWSKRTQTNPILSRAKSRDLSKNYPPLVPAMFESSVSGDDKQGDVRDEIEHNPQHLIKCNERINQRVECFPRDFEEPAVNGINPIAGKGAEHRRAEQHCHVNNRAPQKKCLESNDVHSISPFYKVPKGLFRFQLAGYLIEVFDALADFGDGVFPVVFVFDRKGSLEVLAGQFCENRFYIGLAGAPRDIVSF